MTAALLRWWTVPRLNVVIQTHPVLVREVLQNSCHYKLQWTFIQFNSFL